MGEGAINGFKAISEREGNVFLRRYVGRQYGMEGTVWEGIADESLFWIAGVSDGQAGK